MINRAIAEHTEGDVGGRSQCGGAESSDAFRCRCHVNLHRLDLFSLSLFSLVARSGSISKGAELALLAVGAASKRITDLETAVGTVLLERHSRGVTLTVAGQALQRHAQRILSDVDQLAAELSDYASGLVGVVRLWANTANVRFSLPSVTPLGRLDLAHERRTDTTTVLAEGRRCDFNDCSALL